MDSVEDRKKYFYRTVSSSALRGVTSLFHWGQLSLVIFRRPISCPRLHFDFRNFAYPGRKISRQRLFIIIIRFSVGIFIVIYFHTSFA